MFVVIFGDLGQVDDNDDDVCCNLWRPWASWCSFATGWPGSGGWTKSYRVYVYQDLCQAYIGVDRGNSIWILFRGLVEALFCYLWPPLLGWRSGEKHQGCVVGKSLEVLVIVNLEQRGTSWDQTFYSLRLFQHMFWESCWPRCRRHRGRHRDSPLAPRPALVSSELEAFGGGDCLLVPKGGVC